MRNAVVVAGSIENKNNNRSGASGVSDDSLICDDVNRASTGETFCAPLLLKRFFRNKSTPRQNCRNALAFDVCSALYPPLATSSAVSRTLFWISGERKKRIKSNLAFSARLATWTGSSSNSFCFRTFISSENLGGNSRPAMLSLEKSKSLRADFLDNSKRISSFCSSVVPCVISSTFLTIFIASSNIANAGLEKSPNARTKTLACAPNIPCVSHNLAT